jgi:hypothetical protein
MMTKMLPKKNKQKDANTDDAVALAIILAIVKREKDDMRKQFETQLENLELESIDARLVVQDMVLVARISPDDFFALLESSEVECWSLTDLKHIAAAIQNRFKLIKKTIATEDKAQLPSSTAQRLYGYLMEDANADKKAVLQVIRNLHKELSSLEEKFVLNEIQVDHDAQNESDSCIKDSTKISLTTSSSSKAEDTLGDITASSNGEEGEDKDYEAFEINLGRKIAT